MSWLKNSFIHISAAVVLAMESECYMIAGAFFAIGLLQRVGERKEEECIKERVRLKIEEEKRQKEEEDPEEEKEEEEYEPESVFETREVLSPLFKYL